MELHNPSNISTENNTPEHMPFEWYNWPGKNQFFCNGYFYKFSQLPRNIMCGPKEGNFPACTVHFAFLFCLTLFIIFEIPFYTHEFWFCLTLPGLILSGLNYFCIFGVQFRDPGILLSIFKFH